MLDPFLLVLVLASAIALAALMQHVVSVQRRRAGARSTLDEALSAIARAHDRSLDERLAAVVPLLASASRELVMRAAAERSLDERLFEVLASYLRARWGIDALVADASGHESTRERWRRVAALRILARLGHPHAIMLLARAVNDEDGDVSGTALSLLGRSTDPHAVELLLDTLQSPTHSASRVAVYLDQSPQDLGAHLMARLTHENPVVRQWAATLLTRYTDQPSEGPLLRLTGDPDPRVRKAAIHTLGILGDEGATEAALRLLSDDVPYVRAYAARALGQLGAAEQADRVAALLGDGDWWVRFAAREALEMIGTDVWPVLVRGLDHHDRFVRNGAAEVMQNIGVLDSLVLLEAASDNPSASKLEMLRRVAAAGGVRFTESLVDRAGPVMGPRVRQLLDTMGLEHVGVA